MKNLAKLVIVNFYSSIGITPNKTRYKEQVQSRSAIINALRPYMTCKSLAELFDQHHATIIHHNKNHAENIRSWYGYADKFRLAEELCHTFFNNLELNNKLLEIEKKIENLNEIREILIKQKQDEQLQIQNNEHSR